MGCSNLAMDHIALQPNVGNLCGLKCQKWAGLVNSLREGPDSGRKGKWCVILFEPICIVSGVRKLVCGES